MDAGLAAHGHGWPIAAGPRSRTGARVCRAQARHRTKGARAFGYFAPGGVPFFKVTRCKSETIRSRDRRNGYVHQQESRRRSGRHRRNAARTKLGSHSLSRLHPKKMVGCQTAIAGRPAPAVDPGASAGYGLVLRPPSRAGSLLQFDPGVSGRYESAVRPSSRACSYRTNANPFIFNMQRAPSFFARQRGC